MSEDKDEERVPLSRIILLRFWDIGKKFVNILKNLLGITDSDNSNFEEIEKNPINSSMFSDYEFGSLIYQCNICGNKNINTLEELHREIPTCKYCGSNVRFRSIIHLLALNLFGESVCLDDYPIRDDISGIGFSDWEGYAELLSKKINFINTYYHKEPKVDITKLEQELEGKFDFLITSELFEHVLPPVSDAIKNCFKMLKDGGFLILTVPYEREGNETIEHFEDLYDYNIIETNGKKILRNVTKDGVIKTYNNIIIHGGDGETLEMRKFCEKSILRELEGAGFRDIAIYKENFFKFGIYWKLDHHLPIIAHKRVK